MNKIKFLFPIILLTAVVFFVNINNGKKTKPLKFSGALNSLDYWAMQRAYPDKVIPDAGYYSAFQYSKQNLKGEADNNLQQGWEPIGPWNIGGRTISVAINPFNTNTIYAGSASGGLWRSYSGGVGISAWTKLQTGFPVLGVGAIAIDPNDSNTIYIGTGEVYGYQNSFGGITIRTTRGSYRIGILKTTDGGATWTKSLDWTYNQRRGVQVISINPQNPNTIWAGTTEGTYRSYNKGQSWVKVDSTIMVTDLVINPLDTNKVFIACGNLDSPGNGIYRTLNAGNTWTKLTNGLPASYGGKAVFSMYKTSPNVIFVSIGFGANNNSPTQLCKTTNNGDSWIVVSDINYATYQGWYSHFVGVNPIDSSKVLTAGIDIFKSTNGGYDLFQKSVWTAWYFGRVPIGGPEGSPVYSHADHHCITYHPTNPDIIYFGNDGGVFRTTNGGETFEGCNGGYQSTQFYNGFSSARTDSLFSIGGMQDNSTAIYDGDLAWIRVLGGDGCWTAINYRNKDTLYGTYQYLNILRSTNMGVDFGSVSPPGNSNTSFVAPFIVGKINPQIMYSGRSVVYKSLNAGESWEITNNGAPLDGVNPLLTLEASPVNDNMVYATTAPFSSRAKVFKTTNGGDNWIDITGNLPDRYMIDIAIHPTRDSIAYITLSGFGSSHLFRTTNAGTNWTDFNNNLPDLPTSAVVFDPIDPHHMYVGNDLGVYVSTDAGFTWQEFKTGMPDGSIVIDLVISHINRKLRAVTHGNGIFERPLLGVPIGVVNNQTTVKEYKLSQNYPNPFNPATTIKYDIAQKGLVTIKIYDITGREISTLVNEVKNVGSYSVLFDASNLASGVYFYKLSSEGFVDVKKMSLVK